MTVITDLQVDVEQRTESLKVSEQQRSQLQEHIKQTGKDIDQDKDNNKAFQDKLIQENQEQREEIKRLKELLKKQE